ncbi:unnamed protein product, partial [Brassica oleracea var. botrytis]
TTQNFSLCDSHTFIQVFESVSSSKACVLDLCRESGDAASSSCPS